MKKLPNKHDDKELYEWLKFIAAEKEEDMSAQAVKNKEINEAYGILKEISKDEALQMLEFYRERERMDNIARAEYALEIGEKRGLEIGKVKCGNEAIESIINYIKDGYSPEEAESKTKKDLGLSE